MNKQKFEQVMTMVDDDLLEEAAAYRAPKKKRLPMLAGAAAACLLVAVSAFSFFGAEMGTEEQQTTIANPMQKVSSVEITQLGYSVPLPADAAEEEYFLINTGTEIPMAEVRFLSNDTRYTCRTLKTNEPADISGIYAEWAHDYNWETEELQIHLAQAEDQTVRMEWYAPESGTQWSLSGGTDAMALMNTAREIVETLGYNMAVSPAEAENVRYAATQLDGLEIGETVFILNGIEYTYRTVATMEIKEDFVDISGVEDVFDRQMEGEILWCPARLYFNENGGGKIVWFDVAPGLLYSLHMSEGADSASLTEMAELLFDPAQDNAE